ncbi:MAG: hypothetical protein JNL01_10815 [Bdellovibrionales bacterium]|nr:hypothetical protein [Bdellovibrionales bacterium]
MAHENSNSYRIADALTWIWSFFRGELTHFKILLPISLSYGLANLVVPLGVQVLLNRILETALTTQILTIVLFIGLGLTAAAFLRILQRILVEKMQRRFHSRVVLAASQVQARLSSPQASHIYYDTFVIQKAISTLLMEGFGVIVQLFFALLLLAFYHPFFLAFDLVIVLSLLAILRLPSEPLMSTAINESSVKHGIADFIRTVKPSDPEITKSADQRALNYVEIRLRHFRLIVAQMIGLSGLHIVSMCVLLGLGSYFVINEQMSLGQLVAAELVFSAAFASIEKLNKHIESFYDLVAALIKVSKIVVPKEVSS